jgi:hypothetical protein
MGFFSGYALGNHQLPGNQDQVEEVKDNLPLAGNRNSLSAPDQTKDIVIVFTVDELKKIHVLNVSGGYNMLTEYIRKSLEGRVLESGNAVPGINYVMTLKFPSSV